MFNYIGYNYFDNIIVDDETVFRLPYGSGTLPFKEIKNLYPEFIKEMNGQDETSSFCFYYELNPISGIYEFSNNDAEYDIADMMGIDLNVCVFGEACKTDQLASSLSTLSFHNNLEKAKQNQNKRKKVTSNAEKHYKKILKIVSTVENSSSPEKRDKAVKTLKIEIKDFLTSNPCDHHVEIVKKYQLLY